MKILFRIISGFVYLGVLFFCLIALAKPGAAIFYKDYQIETSNLSREGNAFSYSISFDHQIYDLDTLLIVEDEQILSPVNPKYTMFEGEGVYSFERIAENQVTIQFTPTEAFDPAINGHSYHISIRPYFVTSNWVLAFFLLFALGLVVFFISSIVSPKKREILLASPFGIVKLWNGEIDQILSDKSRGQIWKNTVLNLVLISFLYVLMEWVFFVTKPSFMDIFNWGEKFNVLFVTGMGMSLLSLLTLPLLFLIDIVLFSLFSAYQIFPLFFSFRKYLYHIPTAFLMICLAACRRERFCCQNTPFWLGNWAESTPRATLKAQI